MKTDSNKEENEKEEEDQKLLKNAKCDEISL